MKIGDKVRLEKDGPMKGSKGVVKEINYSDHLPILVKFDLGGFGAYLETDLELFPNISIPEYYDNSKGSLYKVATDRNWNTYIFDVVKRLERGGKKDPLKQEIEKSIAVLQIWIEEIK